MNRIETLRKTITSAKRTYYYSGTSLYNDQLFDSLLQELKTLDPTDPLVTEVGTYVPEDTQLKKVTHTVPTNSLAKADDTTALKKWYDGLPSKQLSVQLKADGATLLLYYKNGVLDMAVTRGGDDGIGEDVTFNAVKFNGVPKTLVKDGKIQEIDLAVRGEAILFTADHAKIDPELEGNARNIGNGMVRRTDGTNAHLITFVAFNSSESSVESETIEMLNGYGFHTIPTTICNSFDEAVAEFNRIGKLREEDKLPFKIDGVVFKLNDSEASRELGMTSGRPKGEIVMKFEAPQATTKVCDVVISLGHDGSIKPTASLVPVEIDNTMVKSAQLNNWDIIAALDIAIGDTVVVQKAKDIIPEIVSVVERAVDRKPIPEPTVCPFCGQPAGRKTNVSGDESANTYCLNNACPERSVRKIDNWINKHNILGIGDAVLRAMVKEFKMENPADLYRMVDCLNTPSGIWAFGELRITKNKLGESNAAKIIANINKVRSMSLNKFLGSIGVNQLGSRRAEQIREKVPGELDTIEDWLSDKILKLDIGFENASQTIYDSIQELRPVILDILKYVTILPDASDASEVPAVSTEGPLNGQSFCLTGKFARPKALIESEIRAAGGLTTDEVKKDLTYLVLSDPNSTSNKTTKAKKYGCKLITEVELLELMKG